jgi:regulator of replication initiation timing
VSELIRYTGKTELGSILGSPHWEHPEGEWVKWEDYARLKAACHARQAENSVLAIECDSLKAEVEQVGAENAHLNKGIYSLSLNVVQLKDEVERLTKAGDAMCKSIDDNGCHDNGDWDECLEVMKRWNAAKEGQQS